MHLLATALGTIVLGYALQGFGPIAAFSIIGLTYGVAAWVVGVGYAPGLPCAGGGGVNGHGAAVEITNRGADMYGSVAVLIPWQRLSESPTLAQ